MQRPPKKVAFLLVLMAVIGAGSSACAGTAGPIQVPVQATVGWVDSTVQQQAPESTSTPNPPVAMPTDTPAFPTVSPTASLPALEILNDLCYSYSTEGGSIFQIAGEVRNNSNIPMGVWIDATVYDSNNQVVGTVAYNSIEFDAILPGGKSPFLIDSDEWPEATTCKELAQGVPVPLPLPRQDIKILSQESYSDSNGLHIRGEVQNTGTTPAEKVRVYATLYDVSGKVVAVVSRPTTPDTIPAGGISPFEFYPLQWSRYDHFEMQVQGRDVESP